VQRDVIRFDGLNKERKEPKSEVIEISYDAVTSFSSGYCHVSTVPTLQISP
jgi:hypothetical protein